MKTNFAEGKQMRSTIKILVAVLFLLPLLAGGRVFGYEADDSEPDDVTARVARISLLQGEAKIKHAGFDDWELVVQNMPIVEGDEIVTEGGARLEIQFDSFSHLRMAEDSALKVETLQDSGVALSLSQGTLSLRLTQFDKANSYFEIDAPKTTVAIQQAGRYRIDAGFENSPQARIAVTDGGEARVYSDNDAFTLRSGRSASIQLSGDQAGDWEMADAAVGVDEFDTWTADRDRIIADLLKNSYYDQYYDRDIYGAEDLSGYGDWVHTNDYGYVWRPYQSVIGRYDNWSPYRYGQWRWIPPFGWTWVNDEPWGWATYHHGRWFYDNGFWYWSPYGYYRPHRSWWRPALVSITIVNNDVCWYPLTYYSGYRNYNRWRDRKDWRRDHGRDGHRGDRRPGTRPTPSPTPAPVAGATPAPAPGGNPGWRRQPKTPPTMVIPPSGIVTVSSGQFGSGKGRFATAPAGVARTILAKRSPDAEPLPELPSEETARTRMSPAIKTERPKKTEAKPIQTGVMLRKTGAPMDDELRRTRILVNHPQQRKSGQPVEPRQVERPASPTPETGVMRRSESKRQTDVQTPAVTTTQPTEPRDVPRLKETNRPVQPMIRKPQDPVTDDARPEPPVVRPRPEERRVVPPAPEERRVTPPAPRQDRRVPPSDPEERRTAPTPRPERPQPPRQETPTNQAPRREEQPRNAPPPKRDNPPPQKSEPKEERRPAPPSIIERKRDPKDGR